MIVNLQVAVLRHLHSLGLVVFDEQSATGDAFETVFPADTDELVDLPSPDEAVVVAVYGANPVAHGRRFGTDEPTFQIRVRGAPYDPDGPQERSRQIMDALHSATRQIWDPTGDAQVLVLSCHAIPSWPVFLEIDEIHRHHWVANYAALVKHPTGHRK